MVAAFCHGERAVAWASHVVPVTRVCMRLCELTPQELGDADRERHTGAQSLEIDALPATGADRTEAAVAFFVHGLDLLR